MYKRQNDTISEQGRTFMIMNSKYPISANLQGIDSNLSWKAPDYTIVGYGLKVMSFGKEIKHLRTFNANPGDWETYSYDGFRKMFPMYDSDDYYFILYPIHEHGLSRKCVETIVDACSSYQKDVIVSGDISVFKPLKREDIAKMTGYDISTVSRACNGACIYTSHRDYPITSTRMSSSSVGLFNQGVEDTISSHVIRDKISDIINGESKAKPLTDDEIVECLQKFGLNIARRTVVKYRTQLGLPSSSKRKVKD